MAAGLAPAAQQLRTLVLDSLAHTAVALLPLADIAALHTPLNTQQCAVTGAAIAPGAGYFVQFSGARTADGKVAIINTCLSKRAASAVMAVNYVVRFLKIVNVEAAKTVVADVEAAGSAAVVQPGALLRKHCLVDARGLVDAHYKVLLRQLVLLKGVIYPDLELPPLFARAYDDYAKTAAKAKKERAAVRSAGK